MHPSNFGIAHPYDFGGNARRDAVCGEVFGYHRSRTNHRTTANPHTIQNRYADA